MCLDGIVVVDSPTLNDFCINLDTYIHNTCTVRYNLLLIPAQ